MISQMNPESMALYLKTVDGHVHYRRIIAAGHDYVRIYHKTLTKDDGVEEETIYVTPTQHQTVFEVYTDQLIYEGWDYDKAVAMKSCPTFQWDRIPKDFRFGRVLHNPDRMRLGNGAFRFWEPVRGQAAVALIGTNGTLLYDRNMKEIEVDRLVRCSLENLYPQLSVVRGVFNGTTFTAWDVPFLRGEDRITFHHFENRLPRGENKWVRRHIELSPWDVDVRPAYLMTDSEVVPEGTAYAWGRPTRYIKGTWIFHPKLVSPPARSAPQPTTQH